MNVPGRKKSVTSVITLIITVSDLVFWVIALILRVSSSMLVVDMLDLFATSLLTSMLWKLRIPKSLAKIS
jgi:hypothetical protein